VVAAVEHLVEKRLAEILDARPDPGQGIDTLVDAFTGPLFYAALELWVAARTPESDGGLRERLLPVWKGLVMT
jgi:hypothetical protein